METVKGFKVFLPDFTSKEGKMKFKENEIFEVKLPLRICSWGIHFCTKAQHCFSYYEFNPTYIVCEVEALGEIITHYEDSKVCTNKIKIGRILSWAEVLVLANDGINNTGHSNSGDSNSGDSNSGNWNSGNSNSGNSNSGNWNSGDRNSGNSNSGNSNSGNSNSGNSNSGDSNSGNSNSGNSNSGNSNSGNSNSGNWNSGDSNSGDSNSGNRNGGAFCSDKNPKLLLFDKPTDILVKDWENSKAVEIMNRLLDQTIWVYASSMTDEEKKAHPKYETTDGFLKVKTMHEAWADMWGNLGDTEKKVFLTLPNFDAKKFTEITGIKL